MCLPALAIEGDTFQQAVDARRSGNGTPGAIGFGLTRDRAASAIPRTQPNDELARLTQTSALETTPMIEGGLDEDEEGVDTVAASAALGAMLSRVKGMAAAHNGSEGPSEEDLARSFFEECASASDEYDAEGATKREEKAENQEEPPTAVMASALLAALDTQAALLTDTDADADPSSNRSESSAHKESTADHENRKTKSQVFLLFSQSAVLQKLQATPPLRDALLALNGSSNLGGASGWGSSSSSSLSTAGSSSGGGNSSSGKGEGPVANDRANGANGAGLNEMDWLVFCEAVKDLMKWNGSIF